MVRLADPRGELPVKNHKYIKNCTELYLAQRGIGKLANFDAFVNLEVLWVNDNEVQSVLCLSLLHSLDTFDRSAD